MEAHLHGNNSSNTQSFAEKISPNNNNDQEAPPSSTSSSSSPSHEFSFTISLQSFSSSSTTSSSLTLNPNPNLRNSNKTTSSSSSHLSPFAIDLTPADDIFFHGHLLPLHFLSHVPVSPRTSTNSVDGCTLPVKNLLQEQPTTNNNNNIVINKRSTVVTNKNPNSSISNIMNNNDKNVKAGVNGENRAKSKKPNKSFSLFGLPKWRKGFEQKEKYEDEEEEKEKQKNKKVMSLDLSHAFRKYIRMLFQRRENGTQLKKRQAYSFSTSASTIMGSRSRNNYNNGGYKRDLRGRRGEFSAPASMRTSPANSGHLLVSAAGLSSSSSSSSNSTMEELQAAIQAAIAHCKNSNLDAVDHDKVKNYS